MSALLRQFTRYGIIGVLSVAAYLSLLWIAMHVLRFPAVPGNLFAYGSATVFNYYLNYYWAFATKSGHLQASRRFFSVVAAGVVLNGLFVAWLSQMGFKVEVAAFIFACLWPFVSFASLRLWALR